MRCDVCKKPATNWDMRLNGMVLCSKCWALWVVEKLVKGKNASQSDQ